MKPLALVMTLLVLPAAGISAATGISSASDIGPAAATTVRATARLATASADDGNVPRNVLDSNLSTRWSALGDGQWLTVDLGTAQTVGQVKLAFYSGNTRRSSFALQLSTTGTSWSTVWSGQSSGTTTALETFTFTAASVRYVRYLGHGNSVNLWNSLTEFEVHVTPATSARLAVGTDGRLQYFAHSNGDTVPDFSHAGYGGGGVALPNPAVKQTVSPGTGDDGPRIQAAIDAVGALTADASGFRGAVLLNAGTYEIAGSLTLNRSGVVLRGSSGTVLRATGTGTRNLINVSGSGSRSEVSGSRQRITDSYVPVGTRSMTLASVSGFSVGDDVVVVRTPNQQWIDYVGMDACSTTGTSYDTSDVDGSTCLSGTAWTPAARTIHYERKITAISGNRITVDAPVMESMQSPFGGGAVYRYTFSGRIHKVGVENVRIESDYASDTDEAHAEWAVSLGNVQNAWLRNVTSAHFVQGTVRLGGGAKHVTVTDSASLDHKSQITGGRRYPFDLEGASHVLVMRSFAQTGRHDFVSGANSPGPNVFLDSRAETSYSELGPHHRWGVGTLFDNVVHQSSNGSQQIGAYNRGNSGTGHGWSGAYQVFYNCLGDKFKIANPPGARNWVIGCRGPAREGNGEYDAFGGPVGPWSLYLEQLQDRLGDTALRNIGY
jgi:hypothetical protein